MSTKKVVGAALAGAAVGAAIGVLTAPAKGSETRKKIKDTAQSKMDSAKTFAKDKLDDAKDLASSALNKVVKKA